MKFWPRAILVCGAAAALAAAQSPPRWAPAAAPERALLARQSRQVAALVDRYDYAPLGGTDVVLALATPWLQRHTALEVQAAAGRYVLLLSRQGAAPALIPLGQGGRLLPNPPADLHNIAVFNALMAAEPGRPSKPSDWSEWVELYLALTGAPPPATAPQPSTGNLGDAVVAWGPWQFWFSASGLIIRVRLAGFGAGGLAGGKE